MKWLSPILLLLAAFWAALRRRDTGATGNEHTPGYYEPATGWEDDDFTPRVSDPPEKRTGGASR